MPHFDQNRLGGKIVVPQVVVHGLKVPQPLTAGGIERDQRIAEQVRPLAVAAVIIGRRRGQRQEHDAALGVDAED